MAEQDIKSVYAFLKDISAEFCALGESYAYARITSAPRMTTPTPRKINGMIMLMVKNGSIDLEINLQRYLIEADSFVVLTHGAMVNMYSDSDNVEIYMMCFSTDFLHTVNINFSAVSMQSFIDHRSPAQAMSKTESSVIMRYFDLMRLNATAKVSEQIEGSIASSLLAAMFYQLVQFHYKRIGTATATKGQRSCRNAYVHDFIKLVHVHYSHERSVKFYADKLCISPKYLSLLVKEVTGKSAARWIDEFVTMEAKNLLRFSGKNVQQVAYALNFSNQSSFGKYFKHMTGQSPTEYQKS